MKTGHAPCAHVPGLCLLCIDAARVTRRMAEHPTARASAFEMVAHLVVNDNSFVVKYAKWIFQRTFHDFSSWPKVFVLNFVI